MSAPLVSVAEFAGWVGESIDPSDNRASQLLAAASALVRSEAGRPEWDSGSVPAEAKTVVLQAAERKWRNPTGASSVTRSAGPFSNTLSFNENISIGLYLTSEERSMLGRYHKTASGLWVQPTGRDPHLEVHRYLDVDPPGEPVLYYADRDFP